MIALPEVYSQRDNRWKNKKLGFSTVSTLGAYGCIVTCLAMIARYFGKETDPGKMNDDLKGVDGFQSKVYYKWGRLNRLYSDISFTKFVNTPDPVTPAQFAEIDAHLQKGFLVMLKVDSNPATTFVEQHFVLLVRKVGNSYKIADPWTGTIESFTAKYGMAKYAIQRFILYEGPLQGGGDGVTPKEKEIQNDIIHDLRGLEKEVREGVPGQIRVSVEELEEKLEELNELIEIRGMTPEVKEGLIESMATITSIITDPETGINAIRAKANDALDQVAVIPDIRVELKEVRGELQVIRGHLEKSGVKVGEFGLLDRLLFEVAELWKVIKKALKGGEK